MAQGDRKRILFVSPRYGVEVNGGAEMECRAYAEHLTGRFDVSVLTTCAVDHMTWKNEYKPGCETLNGVSVIRVENARERRQDTFGAYIARVMNPDHSHEDEVTFIDKQGPYCPKLIKYLQAHKGEYDAVIFVTYLYYHVIYGTPIDGVVKILIPTVHDEWAAHLGVIQDVFRNVDGYIYNTDEEKQFADRQYPGAAADAALQDRLERGEQLHHVCRADRGGQGLRTPVHILPAVQAPPSQRSEAGAVRQVRHGHTAGGRHHLPWLCHSKAAGKGHRPHRCGQALPP